MTTETDGTARMARERKTIRAMVRIFCRAHHGSKDGPCGDCAELQGYAECRVERCPFGAEKPTCADCPIHCYEPGMRESVREVMRYAGPRMMLRHPILALLHVVDGWRPAPQLRRRGRAEASGRKSP